MAGKHISIPALLKIGAGALDNLGIYLKELQLQKVVVLFGNGLVEMFGSTVMEALQQEDIDILYRAVGRSDQSCIFHAGEDAGSHRHRWRKSD